MAKLRLQKNPRLLGRCPFCQSNPIAVFRKLDSEAEVNCPDSAITNVHTTYYILSLKIEKTQMWEMALRPRGKSTSYFLSLPGVPFILHFHIKTFSEFGRRTTTHKKEAHSCMVHCCIQHKLPGIYTPSTQLNENKLRKSLLKYSLFRRRESRVASRYAISFIGSHHFRFSL